MSKTKEAIKLVDAGMKPFAAAKEIGIAPNTLYLALKVRREKIIKNETVCPCCGHELPEKK